MSAKKNPNIVQTTQTGNINANGVAVSALPGVDPVQVIPSSPNMIKENFGKHVTKVITESRKEQKSK
jgi:hypothetical protein